MPTVIPLMQRAARALSHLVTTRDAQRDLLLLSALNPHLNFTAVTLAFDTDPQPAEWRTRDDWKRRGVTIDAFAASCTAPAPALSDPHTLVPTLLYPHLPARSALHPVALLNVSNWPLIRERTELSPPDALLLRDTPEEQMTELCDHAVSRFTNDPHVAHAAADALYQLWMTWPPERDAAALLSAPQIARAVKVIRQVIRQMSPPRLPDQPGKAPGLSA